MQAGAYLQATNIGVDKYLQFYNETWARLMALQNQFPLQDYPERSVLTTWKMSYDQVHQIDPQATRLLDLWSFLHAGDIWYELVALSSHISGQDDTLEDRFSIAAEELSFQHSLSVLYQYSLVVSKAEQGFSIHPVVHTWCLHNIAQMEAKEQLCGRAIGIVAGMAPSSTSADKMVVARRLVPHARVVAGRHLKLREIDDLTYELHTIADLLKKWDSLQEAEGLYIRALKGKEKALGAEHRSTLETVNNLGILYRNQGKLAQAEEMFVRALEGGEKALGAEHTSTLGTVNNLGNLYLNQGKLAQAEEMYVRALKGKEKALGAEHTSTLETVNNLGVLYWNQGKLAQAEEMYVRALEGREKALGAEHTSTLETVNNLGVLYWNQGKLAQAEEMYVRALKGKEKALGAEHTSTLETVNNLGVLYRNQGKLAQAEEMYVRALKGKEKALGAEHTSTLETVNNLGILYRNQGKLAQAEEMYVRALKGREKALGAEHTSTLETVNDLGNLYLNQGKLAQAEELYVRALEGREKALGAEHTSTLGTVNNLGVLYRNQGKLAQAEETYVRALKGYQAAPFPNEDRINDLQQRCSAIRMERGMLLRVRQLCYFTSLTVVQEHYPTQSMVPILMLERALRLKIEVARREIGIAYFVFYGRITLSHLSEWKPDFRSSSSSSRYFRYLSGQRMRMSY